MSNEPLILAIDNGTQSVRALLFDARGHLLAQGREPLEAYFSTQPGWAEQHPEYYWESLGRACQALWQSTELSPEAVAGVTVTTQRGTVVNLDRDGKPLRPAIVWLDQRRAEVTEPVKGPMGWVFKALGLSETIHQLREQTQANWIAQNQPEIWEKTEHFLLLSGYLNWRLTGEFVDSSGSQVGYIPFDYKRQQWASPKDFKWQIMAVKPHMLPALKAPGERLGDLQPQAAAHLGLPAGLPVIAAASDKACEVLGCGALTPETACLSFGTTATINTCSSRYVETTRFLPPYPAAVPQHYCSEVMIYRGFWMVSWFRQEFGLEERLEAERQGVSPESLLERLVEQTPPGSMGLMLQPYWSPGVRNPGPEAKGSIIGFGDVHNRAHVYRALLEGLAYGLREGRERIEKRSRVPITCLRVAGGGSQSDAAMQLTADIFGMATERAHIYETSGLGAAINGAVGLGLHPDYATAVAAMTRPGQRFEPDPEHQKRYDSLYRQVYQPLYRRLQPLYRRIRTITGYPD